MAIGGDGGNGCIAFSRENYGNAIPDGGTGGDGGSVWFEATPKMNSLFDLRRAHFKGNPGKPGKGQKRNGLTSKNVLYSVPQGTEIW